jgi:hypothetical protein
LTRLSVSGLGSEIQRVGKLIARKMRLTIHIFFQRALASIWKGRNGRRAGSDRLSGGTQDATEPLGG